MYCAKIVAVHKRAYLQTVIHNKDNEVLECLVKAVDSALQMFVVRAERIMGSSSDYDQLELYKTDKVTKILEILQEYKYGSICTACWYPLRLYNNFLVIMS